MNLFYVYKVLKKKLESKHLLIVMLSCILTVSQFLYIQILWKCSFVWRTVSIQRYLLMFSWSLPAFRNFQRTKKGNDTCELLGKKPHIMYTRENSEALLDSEILFIPLRWDGGHLPALCNSVSWKIKNSTSSISCSCEYTERMLGSFVFGNRYSLLLREVS